MLDQLIDALRASASPAEKLALVPPGYTARSLRTIGEAATQPAGTVRLERLSDLADYHIAHATPASIILASRDKGEIVSVLDWHQPENIDSPADPVYGFARHRARFSLAFTPEWIAWNAVSGRAVNQTAFAEFIEENLPEVIEPDGAALLEMVRHVSGKKSIVFESARNLANGDVQITYKEDTQANGSSKGEIAMPSHIVLRLPVYKGAERATTFDVKAFLRFRVADGKLTYELKLHRPEKAVELAFVEVCAELSRCLVSADCKDCVRLGTVEKWPEEILG